MNEQNKWIPNKQDWIRYISGTCPAEQAQVLESLLLVDDAALDQYMQVMDSIGASLPDLEQEQQFVQSVMEALPPERGTAAGKIQKDIGQRRWFEHRLFHYAVAACLTLIFLSAGWFDKLVPGHFERQDRTGSNSGSYSAELVKVTTGWLDRLKP